jgi:hypothetical protein
MTGHPGRLPGMTKVWVATMGHSTGYAAVDAVLEELLAGVRDTLGPHLVGVYLDGSLAAGDFAENSSDIDVLLVTEDAPPDEVVAPMTTRWAQAALDERWTPLIEAALAWSNDNVPDLGETLGFIDDTRQASER